MTFSYFCNNGHAETSSKTVAVYAYKIYGVSIHKFDLISGLAYHIFMKIVRKQSIEQSLAPKRVLVIYGPRRVGKTTMLKNYLASKIAERVFSGVGDDIRVRELFASGVRDALLDFASPYSVIAIDEAQMIPSLGLGIKMIIDAFPEKTIILTGSSSFDLSSGIAEPLTGRHYTVTLFPIAQDELDGSKFELKNNLEQFLRYGSYPEVILAPDNTARERILHELVSSYLYKDVLALEKIKSPETLKDIARMIAFQVGKEVSHNEIAMALKIDTKTVDRYLDLLEKMFVIKKVRGWSKNLRNEITKKARYYFLDTGVRNAVIGQFAPIASRSDVGALWENFIFMELYKRSARISPFDTFYFWRTHAGVEIDIVRESNGKLDAFECKWNKSAREPALWRETYPGSTFTTVNTENYLDILFSEKNSAVSVMLHGIPESLQRDIEEIIRKEINCVQYKVFFFGSRVTGTARDASDIDIGILGDEPIPFETRARVKNKLEKLPTLLKIDLVDFKTASDDFKEVALAHIIPIT